MKRIINTFLLLSFAIMAMAQTSFVVADKNGNSQLVQSLVFQQQQTADRFSWKSDGSATGDIKDLLFIARAKAELATASSNDVTEMLEQLSGTGQADAEAIAAALENNPNVEEAYTEDGGNLIVKNIDGEGDVVYPMYEMMSPFSDIQIPEQNNYSKQKRMPRKASKQYPKVAIFNFFEDMNQYKVQNLITRNIEWDFYLNGYDVDYYTPNNSDPSLRFTYKNLGSVLYSSKNYAAIIIMTHGAWVKGESCLCTGELAGKNDKSLYNWADKKYYKRYPADIQAESNCILYLGICNGPGKDGFNSMSPTIGYTGPTRMAQANAAMMFYLMLNEGYNLKKAVSALQPEPAPYQNTEIYKSNNVDSQMLESETYSERDYFEDSSVHYWLENKGDYSRVHGRFDANGDKRPRFAWIEYVPIICNDFDMMEAFYDYHHDNFPSVKSITGVDEDGWFDVNSYLRKLPENIYICRIEGWTKSEGKRMVEPFMYRFRIVSENFKDNSAEVEDTEESVSAPSILDSSSQQTEEINVATGVSSSFEIDGYGGHSFWALSLDEDIAKVSVNGTSLTVTGVTEGTTYIGVQDYQNKLIAVAKVNVTTGGGASFDGQIVMTRKVLIHHGGWYYNGGYYRYPTAILFFDNDKVLTVGYYDADYWFGSYNNSEKGIHVILSNKTGDEGNGAGDLDHQIKDWYIAPNILDEWFTEKLVIHTDGRVQYFLNDEYKGEEVFDELNLSEVSSFKLLFSPYGWWTGHYTYMDDFYLSTPVVTYSDNFNDGIIDLNIWKKPINPDGLREEDGIIKMEQLRTDQDFNLRIENVPLTAGDDVPSYTSCPDNNHPHLIDLGLPSGTLWACCNVGASKPEDLGDHYAWGETYTKDVYNWGTYEYSYGTTSSCHDIGEEITGTEYDVATAKWGSPWVIPSLTLCEELIDNCSSDWTTESGVNGRRFTGPNGASIFLPAAGLHTYDGASGADWEGVGSTGFYWSSTLSKNGMYAAYGLSFYDWSDAYCHDYSRNHGQSIRPVRKN